MATRGSPSPPPIRTVLLLSALLGATACDVPSSAPEWDTRWVVPGEGTLIPVRELLPDGVRVSGDGTAFLVQVDPFEFGETLGGICGSPCTSLNGQTVPKPPFTYTLSETAPVPAEVISASLTSGRITVEIRNGFAFDPINPGGAAGSARVTIRDGVPGGRLLAERVLTGGADALPPGASTTVILDLSPGPVSGTLLVSVVLDSPPGAPVRVDVNEAFGLGATTEILGADEVLVDVGGQAVAVDPVDLGVEDLDEAFVDRVQGGSLILDAENPFGVTLNADLVIRGPGIGDIVKSVTVGPGSTTRSVPFTREELQSFLGREGVELSGTATVAAPAQATVRPEMEARLDGDLDITLRIGS